MKTIIILAIHAAVLTGGIVYIGDHVILIITLCGISFSAGMAVAYRDLMD